jgi:hypothetical protein
VTEPQKPQPVGSLAQVHRQTPGLLRDPGAGRTCGHVGEVDSAGGDLEEEQHVDAFEEHRVDGNEVTGNDGVGLRGQELPPGRSRATWCGDGTTARGCCQV